MTIRRMVPSAHWPMQVRGFMPPPRFVCSSPSFTSTGPGEKLTALISPEIECLLAGHVSDVEDMIRVKADNVEIPRAGIAVGDGAVAVF